MATWRRCIFVSTSIPQALAELQAYVKEFHTTGLVWNATKEGGNAINLANSKDLELIKTTTTAIGRSKQNNPKISKQVDLSQVFK